jgi:hypothetical protein
MRNPNDVRAELNNSTPCAHVTHSVAQSIANGVATALAFNTVRFDRFGMHDAANNTRLTAVIPGSYLITFSGVFAANATGRREFLIRLNGSTILSVDRRTPIGGITDDFGAKPVLTLMNKGDYVEAIAVQTSGAALDVVQRNRWSPEFAAVWQSGVD